MEISYDKEADAAYIYLEDSKKLVDSLKNSVDNKDFDNITAEGEIKHKSKLGV